MTLNDLERRNSPYFAFFSPISTHFQDNYIISVLMYTLCLKKTSPTFLAITPESIDGFL